jgi:hypothetical protein
MMISSTPPPLPRLSSSTPKLRSLDLKYQHASILAAVVGLKQGGLRVRWRRGGCRVAIDCGAYADALGVARRRY